MADAIIDGRGKGNKLGVDSDGNIGINDITGINKTNENNGFKELNVSDPVVRSTMQSILKQLKIMNMHLAKISDNIINEEDID